MKAILFILTCDPDWKNYEPSTIDSLTLKNDFFNKKKEDEMNVLLFILKLELSY
jgi:hypothetical protein